MKDWINRRFGTWRGLARCMLGYAELLSGRLNSFRVAKPETAQRVVFVCLGNICRSAFGEQIAKDLGLSVASVGLSTSTGAASPEEAVDAAARQGIDMFAHRAVDWSDFEVRPGDLFLVMEIRQAHEVRRRLNGRTDVRVSLLGLWCSPVMPHLHDPFSLSPEYFATCFDRVRQATTRLAQALSTSPTQHQTQLATVVEPE